MASKLIGYLYLTARMPAGIYSNCTEIMMQLTISKMLLKRGSIIPSEYSLSKPWSDKGLKHSMLLSIEREMIRSESEDSMG